MTAKYIYDKLTGKGFDDNSASILSENLIQLDSSLQPMLSAWLESGEEKDFEAEGYSIKKLMSEFGMQYQAALLTIDWLIKEPKIAQEALKKGIR